MFEVNVAGSRTVVRAAAAAGVSRVVYTSSAATLDVGPPSGRSGTRRFLSEYARSKYEAERAVMEVSTTTGMTVICVNPASVQGPGRTSGTARLLIGYLNGKLPAAVDGPLNVIDIADCTRGHLLAEERGVAGERYLLCGASMTLRTGLALLSRLTGPDGSAAFPPSETRPCRVGVHRGGRACPAQADPLLPRDGAHAHRGRAVRRSPGRPRPRARIHTDRGHDAPDDQLVLAQGLIARPLPGFVEPDGDAQVSA